MNYEESMRIIHEMIGNARSRIVNDGLNWMFWGTMIFLASLTTFFLIQFNVQPIFIGWNIFGIIAILFFIYRWVRPKKKVVKNYVDEVLRWAEIGFTISLFVIILSINISVSPNNGFGYFLMIYAFLMIIQGGAMQFRPLIFGAIVNWAGAVAIFYCNVFKYDMLITAVAVLIGYIIPGILLYRKHKKTISL